MLFRFIAAEDRLYSLFLIQGNMLKVSMSPTSMGVEKAESGT